MIVRWHVFKNEVYRTESQLFLNEDKRSDKAVLFCPGFPGLGATMFEQRHASAMVEKGYDVAVLKHKGIRLDTATAPMMVNNAARLLQGRERGETHINGGPATIEDWLTEPVPALKEISSLYKSYCVIGNSFGALSALWSLTEKAAPLHNLESVVLKAGAQGIADDTDESIMRIWKPEYMTMPRITEKVALNDAHEMARTFGQVYKDLPERVLDNFPRHIPLTYLVAGADEILKPRDTQKFQQAVSGVGTIIIDQKSRAWPEHGFMAHDMPDYRTENLLALLERKLI